MPQTACLLQHIPRAPTRSAAIPHRQRPIWIQVASVGPEHAVRDVQLLAIGTHRVYIQSTSGQHTPYKQSPFTHTFKVYIQFATYPLPGLQTVTYAHYEITKLHPRSQQRTIYKFTNIAQLQNATSRTTTKNVDTDYSNLLDHTKPPGAISFHLPS